MTPRCRCTSAAERPRPSKRRSARARSTPCGRRPRKPGGVLLAQGRQAARSAGGARAVSATDEHAERFTLLRPLLFTIAYEIIGSATEADDVLQDSYLRWAAVDLAEVRDTKAYLAQLVTRQSLNTLRAEPRRREDYVGPWLPEPLLLDEPRRLGRRGSGRIGVDGDAGGAGNTRARTSGRCSCCARCSGSATTKSPLPSANPRPRCVRWPTAPASTSSPAANGSSPWTRNVGRTHHPVPDGRGHRRRRGPDGDAGPRRGVHLRQRRQGQRGPASGARCREGRQAASPD